MAEADVMTQRHHKFYDLRNHKGRTVQITSKPKTAARWLAMCRDLGDGWSVTPSMDVWFASTRTDQEDLERWHDELDRRYGL